ncbi:recombination protein NinB [Paradevosia shaoguanensis]|uniref:recombination protein NinB n=1 Tax=Paradevosia shaoguanensis TaxID=1335043 RepID=UPI001933D7AD|nr:recombination protein NinB [Paradevosia shaoguanensis]
MTDRQSFVLATPRVMGNAIEALRDAQPYSRVTIAPPQRSIDQNAKFHAILGDIERSGFEWAGKPRKAEEWKVLLISAHAIATAETEDDRRGQVVPGIEGEFVALRESSANMSVARASSLIEYTIAFCHLKGISLTETERRGFLESREQAA